MLFKRKSLEQLKKERDLEAAKHRIYQRNQAKIAERKKIVAETQLIKMERTKKSRERMAKFGKAMGNMGKKLTAAPKGKKKKKRHDPIGNIGFKF